MNNVEMPLGKKSKKKCYYYDDGLNNMGDILNTTIYDYIFGQWRSENQEKTEILMIGSLLQVWIDDCNTKKRVSFKSRALQLFKGKPKLYVLGSGFIKPGESSECYKKTIVPIAVRGEITKHRLEKNGVDCSGIVLGDFGLIADYLVPAKREDSKPKYKVGIVLHYLDKDTKLLDEYRDDPSVKFIDIQTNIEEFRDEILQCETIISTSLHGLIVSDSYGIPNLPLIVGDKVTGGDYKFKDYYSVYGKGMSFSKPEDLSGKDLRQYVLDSYTLTNEQIDEAKKPIIRLVEQLRSKYYIAPQTK